MGDLKITTFSKNRVITIGDQTYLRLDTSNDPLTNQLTAPSYVATGTGESTFEDSVLFNSGIRIKAGQKIIFDA